MRLKIHKLYIQEMLLLSLLIVKISLNLIKNPIPSAYTVLYFISLIYCISVICSIMPLKKVPKGYIIDNVNIDDIYDCIWVDICK